MPSRSSMPLVAILAAVLVLPFLPPARPAAAQDAELVRRKLAAPVVVDGIPCAATGRARAAFHASGRLESCPLAEELEVQGHRFPAGSWLHLTAAGRLRSAWLARDTELQGHVCKGTGHQGWAVDFHPSGDLRHCFLAREAEIQGVPCRKGSFWGEVTGGVFVAFHEGGALRSCAAARAVVVQGQPVRARQRVHLAPDGALLPAARDDG
jgi:hypothetical protein